MRMSSRFTSLALLAIVALLALPAQAARAAAPARAVVLQIDGKTISSTLTPAQALARAQRYATFHLRVPTHVPHGMTLQDVSISSFGGNLAFATVAFNYAGPGPRAFSLSESKLHVSASGGSGHVSKVRVGKATARLLEIKTARLHTLDLSWFTTAGYDLRSLGSSTRLTRDDLLSVARSL